MGAPARQLAALAVSLSVGGTAAAQSPDAALTLSPERIMTEAARHFPFPGGLQRGLAVKGNDVWSARGAEGGAGLTIIGNGAQAESIILVVSLQRVPEEERPRLMDMVGGVLKAVDPDWSDAQAWAEDARNQVWGAYDDETGPRAGHQPTVHETRNGVIVEVADLPREFVQYVITTRQACTLASGNFENNCLRPGG